MQSKHLLLPAVAGIVLALAGCAVPREAAAPAAAAQTKPTTATMMQAKLEPASVEVVEAHFGVFGADNSGRRVLYETSKFPGIVAAPFGWYIIFKTDRPTVLWREEFELPEAPPTWGPGEAMGVYQISPDRRTAVTERIIPTQLGFIANEWRYAPGDPTGAHAMRVYIDGQLIREFKFNIDVGPTEDSRSGRRASPTA